MIYSHKTVNCPICKKKLLDVGLRNHIINTAEGEAFRKMVGLFEHHPKDFSSVSRAVMLRQMPHFSYYRKNYKLTNKKHLHV